VPRIESSDSKAAIIHNEVVVKLLERGCLLCFLEGTDTTTTTPGPGACILIAGQRGYAFCLAPVPWDCPFGSDNVAAVRKRERGDLMREGCEQACATVISISFSLQDKLTRHLV
jgi:hypothetical protein